MPRARGDGGALLWVVRDVFKVLEVLDGREGDSRGECADGCVLVSRQLWVVFQPLVAHGVVQYHHHQQVRLDVLVLLLLREEGAGGVVRVRAHVGPD